MPRISGQDKYALKMREDLEAALGDMADYMECNQRVSLRIGQAIRRAGLGNLLVPALDDLARMDADVVSARAQVMSVLAKMHDDQLQ
jgi:hypothetical protein